MWTDPAAATGLTPFSLKDAMARTAHSATMLGSRLVVVGGVHGNGSLSSDVLVLHTDTRQVGICWPVMTAHAVRALINQGTCQMRCSTVICAPWPELARRVHQTFSRHAL
jgi:hypothetical protein